MAQSARARVHERHARQRHHRELGRRAREHRAAASAAAGSTTRCVPATPSASAARRLATARARSGAKPSSRRRRTARSTTSRTRDRWRRSRRGRRRAAPTASRCSARPTRPAATGPIRRARCCMQAGANVQMNRDGVLARLADAPRVAPFQPWALGALSASPAAASRRRPGLLELQESRRGAAVPDAVRRAVRRGRQARQRIFVLIGGGNRNYRIIYMDGREQQGQVQGDDDNPLYYGRAVAHWEERYAGRANDGLQRGLLVHERRLAAHGPALARRALLAPRLRHATIRSHVDDPGAYTQPWSSGWELRWVGGEELPVYFCQDNRS